MSSNHYYEERMNLQPGARELSPAAYNATIGGVLLYGFVVDAIIVKLFSGYATNMLYSMTMNYGVTLIAIMIGYAVCCVIGSLMVHRSSNPVVSFIGFNFFALPIGFVLAFATIPYYSSGVIVRAFVLTAVITGVMLLVSTLIPDTFLSMGKALFISLLVCIVVDLIALILGQDLVIVDYAVTFIFTLFVGYDWARANACAKTFDNAVDCAAELYLDIINLFLRILSILGRDN
ncbi:MAG: Bax inhibitor-1 family protein [Lachnospiraceae bacterium]|nr:Bax inhibitor-1 family protein [Lachnospiraceae bacterium]